MECISVIHSLAEALNPPGYWAAKQLNPQMGIFKSVLPKPQLQCLAMAAMTQAAEAMGLRECKSY